MKFHLFIKKGVILFNSGCHDLVDIHFRQDSDFTFHENITTANQVIQFIQENKDASDQCVMFYHSTHQNIDYELKILTFLDSLPSLKLKVFWFTFDFWRRSSTEQKLHLVYETKNHYVQTAAADIEHLNLYHHHYYKPDKMLFTSPWSAYNTSFVEFNQEPKNKIGVSGSINSIHYPERQALVDFQHPGVEVIPYLAEEISTVAKFNNFNKRLNEYLCCFTSSVYVGSKFQQITNTHVILLKVYEILAAGSLLLYPSEDAYHLKKIGLIDRETCMLCPMDKPHRILDYILDPKNKSEIDRIRRQGQKYAREHLNSFQKYQQIKNDVINLITNKN